MYLAFYNSVLADRTAARIIIGF